MLETKLARRAAEVAFRASSRLHLARFDQRSPSRCQARSLLGLVHQAQRTPFGRGHDFRRIRTVLDYRRLVPLADTPCGATLPAALHAAHRAGLRTALALTVDARPRSPLFAGRLLLVQEEGRPERVPVLARPYTLAADVADPAAVARRCADEPVTCLAGPAERLLSLLQELRTLTGKGVGRVWPGLTAVLYSSASADAAKALREALGPAMLLLQTVWGPHGMVAVEDPRHGALRLLHDHGLVFEFLSADDRRLGLEEVEVGVPYELVLTSPAGAWSCRTGRTLCLERCDVPLVRFLETSAAREIVRPHAEAVTAPIPVPAPHRQSAGTPAVLPGSFVHSPWSALAGRE